MRIVETYSHLNGLEYLLVHKPALWEEVKTVLAGVDAHSLVKKVSKEQRMVGKELFSPKEMNRAVGLGFAPLVFLHVKQLPEAGLGLGRALQLWRVAGWQLLTWLMGAAILFYGWGSLGVLLSALAVGAPDGVKFLLASAAGMGQICLTFLSLGAWVAFRTAEAPGPPRGKRSSKAKSP